MKWLGCTLVLLFAVSLVAQQQDSLVSPSTDRPSSSAISGGYSRDATPDLSNLDVLHEIQSRLSTNSRLNNTLVTTTVTDDKVVLSGYVDTQQQHAIAVGIAEQFTDGRELIDQIQTGGLPPD